MMWPRRIVGAALIAIAALAAAAARTASAAEHFDTLAMARIAKPPLGLPPLPIPIDNPPTAGKIALGRKLFFDRRLSHNGTMSCAMCHLPEQGFTNNELAKPIGLEGRSLRRNAPTLLNVAYQATMFHDGRDTSLESQVIGPLISRNEMANPSIGYLIARIDSLPDYEGWFEEAFGDGASIERVGQAIASWERSLLAANAPFDRWHFAGDTTAMTAEQQRGFALFAGQAGCAACHTIGEEHALFTDGAFHDTGLGYFNSEVAPKLTDPVPVEIAPGVTVPINRATIRSVGQAPQSDLGRHEVTLDPADLWRFKTPSLRNVALTAPYMHDGSRRTLEAVVRFYNAGGQAHAGLDALIRPLGLDDAEVTALVAFLEALTGDGIELLIEDARSQAVGN